VLISSADSGNASRIKSYYFWNDVLLYKCDLYKRVFVQQGSCTNSLRTRNKPFVDDLAPRETLASGGFLCYRMQYK
jgi:hypothetical protein